MTFTSNYKVRPLIKIYSSSDFEHLFMCYKTEGFPEGESILAFF